MSNNYEYQSYFANRKVPAELAVLTKFEGTVGMFAAVNFKNNENYLIGYLNVLIHSLLRTM